MVKSLLPSIPPNCIVDSGGGIYAFWFLDKPWIFENDEELEIAEMLSTSVFKAENDSREIIINVPDVFLNAEDLISTLDFKNFILNSREGITVPNSVYIREKELPRNFILSRFLNNVKEGKIKLGDLDEETNENFKLITNLLRGLK